VEFTILALLIKVDSEFSSWRGDKRSPLTDRVSFFYIPRVFVFPANNIE
jgi:hypothetical protein